MARSVVARAPSNIALAKYMGKTDPLRNLPAHASLSLTLDALSTWAEVEVSDAFDGVRWEPELPRQVPPPIGNRNSGRPELKPAEQTRILKQLERARDWALENLPRLGIETQKPRGLLLGTANTFPMSAGIASSASSFAAVTLAGVAICAREPKRLELRKLAPHLAPLSRQGSGSSCRSFGGPWVVWEGEGIRELQAPEFPHLTDLVLLIQSTPKLVSSSEAHRRVTDSPLWTGRVERAAHRCQTIERALLAGDVQTVARESWREAWEMHSLFHTCPEPFTYFEPGTIDVLRWLGERVWGESPPIVTLDAGPNVHLLVESTQLPMWEELLRIRFPDLSVLRDTQGQGATIASVD